VKEVDVEVSLVRQGEETEVETEHFVARRRRPQNEAQDSDVENSRLKTVQLAWWRGELDAIDCVMRSGE
jgi:hypothetical protein